MKTVGWQISALTTTACASRAWRCPKPLRSALLGVFAAFHISTAFADSTAGGDDHALLAARIVCKDSPACAYEGKDLELEIQLVDVSDEPVGIPVDYLQQAGPIIALVDNDTGRIVPLRRNLADPGLLERFRMIPPDKASSIFWIIHVAELEQFDQEWVDVTAVVTVLAPILSHGSKQNVEVKGHVVVQGRAVSPESDSRDQATPTGLREPIKPQTSQPG